MKFQCVGEINDLNKRLDSVLQHPAPTELQPDFFRCAVRLARKEAKIAVNHECQRTRFVASQK